ncbi:hypothetical protein [Glutamicibacter arilaitensis]|uniref:hypothetical protein n=1 Tax=Glutamicibacter arilaitensis TaxID=256701 RepID=UPI00384A9A7D
MSQPIDVGSVLSGRYQVTETVLTTAEGDLVLGGIDQVLNRSVSIMVASAANSSQLATSAREIAMGERQANVQVLDLGITETNQSYLVANVARSADLLDLVLEAQDTPYVEPFFTDTLGTELFGESRQSVPETYEDDAEYYEQLRYEDEPEEQNKVGNALSSGFAGLKNRFGRKNPAAAETVNEDEYVDENTDDQTAPNAQVTTPTVATPISTANKDSAAPKPKVTRLEDDEEPNVTATAALAAAAQSKGSAPKKVEPKKEDPKKPAQKKAAAMAGVAAASAPKASTFPAAAKGVPAQDIPEPLEEEEDEGTSKGIRLLVGAVLIAVLIIGIVFAFNFLGGAGKDTTAGPSAAPTETAAESTKSEPETPTGVPLPAPKVDDVSRLVPGNQQLNAETDDTLSDMIDGNPSSTYKTYSYTTSNFGGFSSNMVFILELEEESGISEINLEGLNATGGDYEILVGTSDDLGDAKSVAKGSFSGPSISVPVKGDDTDQMAGTHVFLNVTDLPRRASGANESRPFGLQIGEFSAK